MGDPFVYSHGSRPEPSCSAGSTDGRPWPHQMRQFLQEAIQILEETRVKRLDSEHYPTVQQFTNDCCADASAFLEMVEGWSCDWRVAFGAVHLAVAGLYAHPDLGAVRVARVPVRGLVREILLFLAERGIAYGKLDAALSGVHESWEEGEHPSKALLLARPSINQLCRTILKAVLRRTGVRPYPPRGPHCPLLRVCLKNTVYLRLLLYICSLYFMNVMPLAFYSLSNVFIH
jgi:hypothetical protein